MPAQLEVLFPDYFDDYAEEIRSKGYFADLTVSNGKAKIRPTFYDLPRLEQECKDAFARGDAFFTGPRLIVLPEVTRVQILSALEALAEGDFADILGIEADQ